MKTEDLISRVIPLLPRVLVLEDDPDTLVLLGKLLSAIPVDAIPTATCTAARYAAAKLGPLQMLIADAQLPDGSGVDLAIELQKQTGCATLILSGDPAPDGGMPPGVDVWMQKPVDVEQLQNTVRALVKIKTGVVQGNTPLADAPGTRRPAAI